MRMLVGAEVRDVKQIDLIANLMALRPPLFLFGGFAEDALLHGQVSRPHGDIDVFVWLDELELRVQQAAELGFEDMHVKFEPAAGRPMVLGATSQGLELELVVAQRFPEGRGFFELPTDVGVRRMWLPDDATAYPEQMLGKLKVRTLSPRLLYQVRIVSADLFGGFRPKDVVAQKALKQRFFADVPEDALQPTYED
jgi:hypothetical protein